MVWYCEDDTEVSRSDGRESSQTAAVREDTQNTEAGGDALRGVKIADGKSVKLNQVRVGGGVAAWRGLPRAEPLWSERREKLGRHDGIGRCGVE